MWITLHSTRNSRGEFYFSSCQVDDEVPYDLPECITTPQLCDWVAQKSGQTTEDLTTQSSLKLRVKLSEFQEYFMEPTMRAARNTNTTPSVNVTTMDPSLLLILQEQQRQAERQQQLMETLIAAVQAQQRQRTEMVKPDPFDGESSSPEDWIRSYEYASEKNSWHGATDRVENMRLFLTGLAKKWYELHFSTHASDSWDSWKASFLAAFQENPVERWDRAIFYKYRSGKPLEYFYEKRRLLQMADSNLPESSSVPLIIHGLPKDLQKQVQLKSPKTIEELLGCFQGLCIDAPPRIQGTRRFHFETGQAPQRSGTPEVSSGTQRNSYRGHGVINLASPCSDNITSNESRHVEVHCGAEAIQEKN